MLGMLTGHVVQGDGYIPRNYMAKLNRFNNCSIEGERIWNIHKNGQVRAGIRRQWKRQREDHRRSRSDPTEIQKAAQCDWA